MDATLVPYFQVVRLNVAKFKSMTDVQILERYDKLMAVVDAKIQKAQSEGKPVDKYKKYKDDIDAMLITMVKVDCDFVRANLAPKFKQNPNDIALAKKIFSFMLQGKCTDDPLWLQAAETVHKDPNGQKDCGLAKNLGIIYMSKDELEKGETFLRHKAFVPMVRIRLRCYFILEPSLPKKATNQVLVNFIARRHPRMRQ